MFSEMQQFASKHRLSPDFDAAKGGVCFFFTMEDSLARICLKSDKRVHEDC